MLGLMTGRVHHFTIGDRLRKAREAAGYDQRGFETASGISRATISAYELGKSTPRHAYLSIWAHVTDTDMGWLLTGDTDQDTNNPRPDPGNAGSIPRASEESADPPARKAGRGWGAAQQHNNHK